MKQLYGQKIEYRFSLTNLIGDSLPELVTARIYDSKPTTAQLDEVTNTGLEEVTTWTDTSDGYYTVLFSPVTDSSPSSLTGYNYFYIVIRFKYETSLSTKYLLRAIRVYRPTAWITQIDADRDDLKTREKDFAFKFDDDDLDAFISDAEEWIMLSMKAKQLDPDKLADLSRLKLACIYFALSQGCRSLYGDQSTVWGEKADFYLAQAENQLLVSFPGYDADENGEITEEEEKTNLASISIVQR